VGGPARYASVHAVVQASAISSVVSNLVRLDEGWPSGGRSPASVEGEVIDRSCRSGSGAGPVAVACTVVRTRSWSLINLVASADILFEASSKESSLSGMKVTSPASARSLSAEKVPEAGR
jgi:hypothetical protein